MQLYIFGNGNLSFDDFCEHYVPAIRAAGDVDFITCDFRGLDTLAMEYLKCVTRRVRVFHIGKRPRYLPDKFRTEVAHWELCGGYEDDVARDAAAIAGALARGTRALDRAVAAIDSDDE